MEKAHRLLKEVFGFDSFRLLQEQAIQRLVEYDENALVLFPTGGGKSLTFQIPALCFEGLTLVISPLLALMKDQVDALVKRGVKAANLDSTLTAERAKWVKDEVLSGSMKILYVAPERLNNETFIQLMSQVKISLLAVDESHCISQWGTAFRPDYLKIARFAEEMNVARVLCLTATATPGVSADICKEFHIDEKKGIFRTPVYRPNLAFKVVIASSFEEKLDRLVPLLQSRRGPAIVYVTLQSHASDVAAALHKRDPNLGAMVYHAGMSTEDREAVQMKFMESEKGIVCATIAFGMGIDKADIRQVIHLYMPKTIENYSQEVGRAGRDGLLSTCTLFLSAPDIPTLEGFCRGDTCHKKSLQLWIQEVIMKVPASDGTLDFNHYQQSKIYDIRMTVLNLCYAQLELNFGLIRAITPYYATYDITAIGGGITTILKSSSLAAQAIKKHWKKTSRGYQIDVVSTSTVECIDRALIARQISDWESSGYITSKPSQVRARYAVLKELPKASEEIQAVVDKIYEGMLKREDDAIQKLRGVITFATDDDCLAHSLASYFGDYDAVPNGMCGRCSFCETGAGVDFNPPTSTQGQPDPLKIQAILNACPERDDPRLLARMAFGITSPRLTAGKWSTAHPLFGSMVDADFSALVAAFDVECKKADYIAQSLPAPASKKRTYSQTTSRTTGGSGSSSRGGTRGFKRGRR